MPQIPTCNGSFLLLLSLAVPCAKADDWPQWLGPQRDSIWREQGIMQTFPKGGPTVKWRAKVAWGYAGPAVQDGRVFLFDFDTAGDPNIDSGAGRTDLEGKERILCLDAATGKQHWKYEYACTYKLSYPAGTRCTPTISAGKVYALGAMGELTCLDAKSGKKIWSKNLPKEYMATMPLCRATPAIRLVDGDRLSVPWQAGTAASSWPSTRKPARKSGAPCRPRKSAIRRPP